MESPRIHGVAEEKSSCESGWTMYIEDTFHGNNHHSDVVYEDYDDGDDGDFHVKDQVDDGGDDDDSSDDKSDDSMTSDASSWPSTQLPKNTKNHAATKNVKQVNHKTKNRACETFSDEEEESELKARTRTRTTGASRVQSRGKVSKTK
ncbi:unnamed protein product [Microthlaspi erraticum]|uniref:Uncharacterized protein n=1 Tax=Microthlaspi erraticum TaxID=1685480 RepID=A0A6D2KKH6_9BRAS|nr:unnamed protein product [Microthlaspi erraticum]